MSEINQQNMINGSIIPPTSPYIVEMQRTVQRYYDTTSRREKTVLNELNFRMKPGTFTAVVGPSGCGKSTMLRLILGSEKHKDGKIDIFGRPPREPDGHRGIVYQRYSLFPHRTVLDNIAFGLQVSHQCIFSRLWIPGYLKKRKHFIDEAVHYLDSVGLAEHASKYPHQLSGGQQQRVAIAQTLITKPEIILMDEPFGALDPGSRERLQEWTVEIQEKQKCSIFLVTHDLEEAVFISSRLVVLSQYYHHQGKVSEGSKIVADLNTNPYKKGTHIREVIDEVRHLGFDKNHCQEEREFMLTHPDAVKPGEFT